jgi:hypothetical protein
MSKYEIDLLINGKLDKKQASALADSLTKSIAKCDNYELDA